MGTPVDGPNAAVAGIGESATGRSTRPPETPAASQVRFHYSSLFPEVLANAGCSLLISTYQAGQLVAIGVAGDELSLSFRAFDRAMGVAVSVDQIAVGARGQIWSLSDHSELAPGDRPPRPLRPVLAPTLLDSHRRDPVP